MKKIAFAFFLMVFAAPAFAEVYTWTDRSGTVNFTEDYGRIPKQYRKKARKSGDEDAAPPPAATAAPKAGSAAPPSELKGPAPVALKEEKKAVYGGKDAQAWRNEFGTLRGDLKAAEEQLAETRSRLEDTSKMSRSEYLSIQYSIKNMEIRVQDLRKKLGELELAAEKSGVPTNLRK